MPKVVTFSVFLPLSISSCAVWASAQPHQEHNRAASIFFIAFLLGELADQFERTLIRFFLGRLAGWMGLVLRDTRNS